MRQRRLFSIGIDANTSQFNTFDNQRGHCLNTFLVDALYLLPLSADSGCSLFSGSHHSFKILGIVRTFYPVQNFTCSISEDFPHKGALLHYQRNRFQVETIHFEMRPHRFGIFLAHTVDTKRFDSSRRNIFMHSLGKWFITKFFFVARTPPHRSRDCHCLWEVVQQQNQAVRHRSINLSNLRKDQSSGHCIYRPASDDL